MFNKKNDKEINLGKVNDLVSLANTLLKVLFILLIILGIYAAIKLVKEINILPFILTILSLLAPLFIGVVIAWLFDPLVTYLEKKQIRRGLGTALCYIVFLGIIVIIIMALIPVLAEQINDFVTNTVPSLFNTTKGWIDQIFEGLNNIENFDANSMKLEIFSKLENFVTNLTSSLPELLVKFMSSLFSGIGVFGIGLIIGFYLLLDLDKHTEMLYQLLPKRYQTKTKEVLSRINLPLKRFVNGALIDCTLIFVICAIGFSIIGLKAPLLFALFCGLTNVIPYAGPYIGGVPAVVVGFSQSTTTGIAVLIFIFVVQTLEGNLLQPLIMSKTTKISPIVIILGLLVFGHFFGIIGMIISTPLLGAIKEFIVYLDEKYDFLNYSEKE